MTMSAITTQFRSRPERGHEIRAFAYYKDKLEEVRVHWRHGESAWDNHVFAMKALREKLGWTEYNGMPGYWHGGEIKGGFVFVYVASK